MPLIYLDHAATTPIDPRVAEAVHSLLSSPFGNPSSVHACGREARSVLEDARKRVTAVLGARSGEIVFTGGGTEADNLAVLGAARAARRRGRDHIVTTAAEHHAVLEACRRLADEGCALTILPVDGYGLVGPEQVAEVLSERTALVSVMHGNNEVGSIAPVRAIAERVHASGALMHTDAVQTAGMIPVNVDELGVDLLSLSAHKFYGPKGVGALYIRRNVEVEPLGAGGGQERGTRPGTENVALAAGCALALELAVAGMQNASSRLASLRATLQRELSRRFPALLVNGQPSACLPHILNISLDSRNIRLEGEMLVVNMDLRGIAVASGSACTSGSLQPSHVLLAMGRDEATARASIRFSFGKSNTEAEIPAVVAALEEAVALMIAQRGD